MSPKSKAVRGSTKQTSSSQRQSAASGQPEKSKKVGKSSKKEVKVESAKKKPTTAKGKAPSRCDNKPMDRSVKPKVSETRKVESAPGQASAPRHYPGAFSATQSSRGDARGGGYSSSSSTHGVHRSERMASGEMIMNDHDVFNANTIINRNVDDTTNSARSSLTKNRSFDEMEHKINLLSPRQLNPKSSEPSVTSIQTYGSNTVGTSRFYNDDLKDQKNAFSAAEITSATNLHSRAAKLTDWLDAQFPVDCPFRFDDPICLPAFGNDVKGKLRWVGRFPDEKGYYAAVELEGTIPGNVHCHNGIYRGYQIYQSNKENITTVSLKECQPMTAVRYPTGSTGTNRQMSARDHTPNNVGETTSWKADNSKTDKSKLYEGAKSAPAGSGQCADSELLPSHIPQEGLPFRIGERLELKSYYNAIATVRWIGQFGKNRVYWMAVEVEDPIPKELKVRCTNGYNGGYRRCNSTRNNIYTATVSYFKQFSSTVSTTTDVQGPDEHTVRKLATRDGDLPICIPDGLDYGIGDRVELLDWYGAIGTIRWIGKIFDTSPNHFMAIEMDDPILPELEEKCNFGMSSGRVLCKSPNKNIYTTWIDQNKVNVRLVTPAANLCDKIPDQRVVREPTPPPPAAEDVELPICIPDGLHYGIGARIRLLDQYNTIGTVRWIGKFSDSHPEHYMAIEVEDPILPELEEKCTFGRSSGGILYKSPKKNIYATWLEQDRRKVHLLTPAANLDDKTPDQHAIHKPTSSTPATRDGDRPISIPAGLPYGVGDRIQLLDQHKAIGTVRWIGKRIASSTTHYMAIQMEEPIYPGLEAKCTKGVLSTGVRLCSSSQKNIYVTRIEQNVRLLSRAANTDGRKTFELSPDDGSTSAGLGASGSRSHHESLPRQPARLNSTENSRFAEDLLLNSIPENSALKLGDYVRTAPLDLVGKVKWIGVFPYNQHEHMVAIELDGSIESHIKSDCTYGSFHGYSVCSSPERNIYLTRFDQCIPFNDSNRTEEKEDDGQYETLKVESKDEHKPQEEFFPIWIPDGLNFNIGDVVMLPERYGHEVGKVRWIGVFPEHEREHIIPFSAAIEIIDVKNFRWRDYCTHGEDLHHPDRRLCHSDRRNIFVTTARDCKLVERAGQSHRIPKCDNDFGKFPTLDQRITQPQAVAHSRSTWNYPTPELHDNKFPTGSHGTREYGNNSWELRTPKGDLALNPMEPGLGPFDVGDLVSLPSHHEEIGTVRWMGEIPNEGLFAAIELFETDQLGGRCTDGRYHRYRLCQSDKQNIFVTRAENCVLLETTQPKKPTVRETPVEVEGDIRPILSEAEVVGTKMGIQGEHNSCYMDASLFSMFAFSSFFDAWMLFGGVNKKHSEKRELYRDIQRTLRTTIVNPLRKNGYVKSVAVQNMRKLLDSIGLVGGLKTDEKDPEELMNLLLNDVFDVKPFMKLSNEQEMHTFHLMADADSKLPFPNIRKLLEFTFNQEKLTLAQVPDCMILHLPRFGKEMKLYDNVFPNEELDISDLLQTARRCFLCSGKAVKECEECFKAGDNLKIQEGTFCKACDVMMHQRADRARHHRRLIENVSGVEIGMTSTRVKLILSAVLCIERSHYVAYVRTKINGPFKWVFFDSMSDREGDQNIPKVEVIPDLNLSEESYMKLKQYGVSSLSPLPKRLFKDAYICIYINPETGQFR